MTATLEAERVKLDSSASTPLLDAARAGARRGIGTFPIRARGKAPAIPNPHPEDSPEYETCNGKCGKHGHGVYDATTDDVQLVKWFGPEGRYRSGNLGAAVPDGVAVLDIDKQHAGVETYKRLRADLGDEWAKAAACERTGNLGVHLWFKEDGAPTKVRTKIGIDVKRAGGYVVVAPSVHENGNAYAWERELPDDLDELPTIPDEVAEWLAPEPAPDVPARVRREYENANDNVDQAVAAETSWSGLLPAHGWTLVRGDGDSDGSKWRHANAHNKESASIRHGCLFNYSTESGLPVTEPGDPHGLTLKRAVLIYEYGDDTDASYCTMCDDLRARGRLAPRGTAPRGVAFSDLVGELDAPDEGPRAAVESARTGSSDGGWNRIDLAPALAGAIERTRPTVFAREDRESLFYGGRLNGLHGDSGTGKSMAMAYGAAQEMLAGHHVMWVDLEDPDATTLIERLRMFGVDDATIAKYLHYYGPREPFTDTAIEGLVREAIDYDVSLLVVDSLGEAFGLNGVNEDKDNEVGPFLRRYLRPLADAGPAVVSVDHSTKANDNPLHPSGSKRKRAAIQGASYLIEATKPLTREHGGRLRLVCAKDRHGNYARGATVATIDLHVYPDEGISVKVWPPEVDDRDSPDAKLMTIARAAVRTAKEAGRPLSQRQLIALMNVKGATDLKRAGIETAVQLGGLRLEPGTGKAAMHSYAKDLT